jgi:PAS domain S-box-containing protein
MSTTKKEPLAPWRILNGVSVTDDRINELETELSLTRRLLDDAQKLARIGSWEWDLATNVVTWSAELYRIYGYEPNSVPVSYENFLSHVHPDDRESVDERNRRCFETHEPFEDVKRVRRVDLSEFLMRTRGEMVLADDGEPLRMIGVCEDVTAEIEAREAERRAERAEAQRRRAMDLNDTVLQNLVLAQYRLEQTPDEARRALAQAVAQCQRIVEELLSNQDGVEPGSLRREMPAEAD